jgi:coenzyme F420-dependent glucose-6-phosphate dehydrogenase
MTTQTPTKETTGRKIGYHACHERFAPSYLLTCVQAAAAAGFKDAMCSDHFHPWSERQGQSGYAWSWLGAALASADLIFGTVSAPGQRYHPAILAQAAATLSEMYPDRLWLALGSGQALNENITGASWPSKAQRNARLFECAQIMRALWQGETVTHEGWATVVNARLYSRPLRAPLLLGAALTTETARWVGSWADGLLTGCAPHLEQRAIVEAFREGGGAGKPMFMQTTHALTTLEEGKRVAFEQWRTNVLGAALQADLDSPAKYDAAAAFVQLEDMERFVRISPDAARHGDWLHENLSLGFNKVFVHLMSEDQVRSIQEFGEHVLPEFSREPTRYE